MFRLLQTNPNYVPLLAQYDLTRPSTFTGLYGFFGHADIKELALYVQDTITFKNLTFNLGLRGDKYNGITSAGQAEPRVGVAYNFKPTNTVLRASYARTLETPFNENLVLASRGCDSAVVNALETIVQGYPCLTVPLSPSTRNEYHVGVQQAFGRFLVIDANTFGSTQIAPLTSASWATHPSRIRSSGLSRRSRAIRYAPACLPSTASLPTWWLLLWQHGSLVRKLVGSGQRPPPLETQRSSVLITMSCLTKQRTSNINSRRMDHGSVSTGAMTAA